MAKNNSSNQDYSNEADGFKLAGGTTKRTLTVTGADVGITGSGTNTQTFPSSSQTLVGRTSADTLTNKTIDGDDNTLTNINPGMWKNPFCFRAYDSGGTTLTDNAFVQINLGTESYDYNNDFATSSYTVPVNGVYHFDGTCAVDNASTYVSLIASVYVNGTERIRGSRTTPGNGFNTASVSADLLLNAGDVVTFRVLQNSAGNESTETGSDRTYFSGHLVHAV